MHTPDPVLPADARIDGGTAALAARRAPLLRFDANEPFLPLAAGVTLFREDGQSPSFEREIHLRPPGKPPAAQAIEYAIWWDWDIHHLYELEHAWVYLDDQDAVVRLEASWHGDFHEIPLHFENDRVVLYSEPGKHAFAPDPSWFRERAMQRRRPDTLAVSAPSGVLINAITSGKISPSVFNNTLARSYLVQQAFEPSWEFTKTYTFQPEALLSWPALYNWIPGRMRTWIEWLGQNITPGQYRALRLAGCDGSYDSLQAAALGGADATFLRVVLENGLLRVGTGPEAVTVDEAFQLCRAEPMGAFLQPEDPRAVEALARFLNEDNRQQYAVIVSDRPALLSRFRELVPRGSLAAQIASPAPDAFRVARETGAAFLYLACEPANHGPDRLTLDWIRSVHQAGLGVIGWPVGTNEERDALQRLALDVVWV